ncbi:MAG: transposase [Puniceicoccales bacterium]
MGTDTDRERVKELLKIERSGWRKERLIALKLGFSEDNSLEQTKAEFPEHEHVVVWDGAGFYPREDEHPSTPEGLHTIMLPPYSPELNPIEKPWDLIQDHSANKPWPSIERLDQVVASLLKEWWEEPRRIIKLVGNN